MINLPVNIKKRKKKKKKSRISHRIPKTMSAKTNPDIERREYEVHFWFHRILPQSLDVFKKNLKKTQQRLIICVKTV